MAEPLDHGSVAFTMDVYAHVTSESGPHSGGHECCFGPGLNRVGVKWLGARFWCQGVNEKSPVLTRLFIWLPPCESLRSSARVRHKQERQGEYPAAFVYGSAKANRGVQV